MNRFEEDEQLLARAAAWTGSPVSRANLPAIVREHGIDFATALIHEQIAGSSSTAQFLKQVSDPRFSPSSDVMVGIVPGAFYREHQNTGADGARVLEIVRSLGLSVEVIPTASFGTLEENARILLDWLNERRGTEVALVSLSKGGADVKHALSRDGAGDAFGNVPAWVSLSGLMRGTPLVEWLRRRPLRWWAVRLILWWRGHPHCALHDLQYGDGSLLSSWPVIPKSLRIVHVCGFPLRRHLSHAWAPRAYERLASLGPNDGGGNLLGDVLDYPGIVCPIWGADHYLTPPWDASSLLAGIISAAVERRQATTSATHPSAAPAMRSSA